MFPGIPIRTTLDNSTAVQYAGLLRSLTMKARSTIRDIDPQNDLTFLRLRSKKHEILVAPGELVVVTQWEGGLMMASNGVKEELCALLFVLWRELTGRTPLSLLQRMTSC